MVDCANTACVRAIPTTEPQSTILWSGAPMRFDVRLKTVIIGLVGAALVTGAILRAMDLGWRRERALDDAERRAAGLAGLSSAVPSANCSRSPMHRCDS